MKRLSVDQRSSTCYKYRPPQFRGEKWRFSMKNSALFAGIVLAASAIAIGASRAVKKHGGLEPAVDKLKQHPAFVGAADAFTALTQHPAVANAIDKFRKQPEPLPAAANTQVDAADAA